MTASINSQPIGACYVINCFFRLLGSGPRVMGGELKA